MGARMGFVVEEASPTSALEVTPSDLRQMKRTEEFRLWLAAQQNDDATIYDRAALSDFRVSSQVLDRSRIVDVSTVSLRRRSRHDSFKGWIITEFVVETLLNEEHRTNLGADQSGVDRLVGQEERPDWMSVFDGWNEGEGEFAAEMNKTLVWRWKFGVRSR
ncbi:hypothetical protein MBLNU457_4763t1 [Dothideomycetes sp. NU457]